MFKDKMNEIMIHESNYSSMLQNNVGDAGEPYIDSSGKPIKNSYRLGPDLYVVPAKISGWYKLVSISRSGTTEVELSGAQIKYLGKMK